MKSIHQPIKNIMKYYSDKLHNNTVNSILSKESIDSEEEAKSVIAFLNDMCSEISKDSENNIVVLSQPIHTTDAEKVCDVIEDYIEEIGYGHLFE